MTRSQGRRAARWTHGVILPAVFVLPFVHRALAREDLPDDPLDDDLPDAIQRVRERLSNSTITDGKYGVVMVVAPTESSFSQLTIPIWRAYCKRHQMGFFIQEEPLTGSVPFGWTKPRLLMELLPMVKWRYALVVDADSLPAEFDRSFEFLIKIHMRHKRYANDDVEQRAIFCPWNCDEEYTKAYDEGACNGPVLSVCLFAAKKQAVHRLVKSWHVKRRDASLLEDNRLLKAFERVQDRNYDQVFLKDIQLYVGKASSKFIKTLGGWSKEYGWGTHDRIRDVIKKHPRLSHIANEAQRSEEL